jgi:tetrahydromethanopterin S-methyltransferase subunit B
MNALRHPTPSGYPQASTPTDELLLQLFAKLDQTAFGIAVGLVLGGGIFLATIFLVLKGGDRIGPNLALLGQYFFGYTVTLQGSLMGLAYGFIVGFMLGWMTAFLRNLIVNLYIYKVKLRTAFNSFDKLFD